MNIAQGGQLLRHACPCPVRIGRWVAPPHLTNPYAAFLQWDPARSSGSLQQLIVECSDITRGKSITGGHAVHLCIVGWAACIGRRADFVSQGFCLPCQDCTCTWLSGGIRWEKLLEVHGKLFRTSMRVRAGHSMFAAERTSRAQASSASVTGLCR